MDVQTIDTVVKDRDGHLGRHISISGILICDGSACWMHSDDQEYGSTDAGVLLLRPDLFPAYLGPWMMVGGKFFVGIPAAASGTLVNLDPGIDPRFELGITNLDDLAVFDKGSWIRVDVNRPRPYDDLS